MYEGTMARVRECHVLIHAAERTGARSMRSSRIQSGLTIILAANASAPQLVARGRTQLLHTIMPTIDITFA